MLDFFSTFVPAADEILGTKGTRLAPAPDQVFEEHGAGGIKYRVGYFTSDGGHQREVYEYISERALIDHVQDMMRRYGIEKGDVEKLASLIEEAINDVDLNARI